MGFATYVLRMTTARLIAALGFTLLAAPAMAGKDDPEWNPPARYDHPYEGKLTVIRLPQADVVKACDELFKANNPKRRTSMQQRGCSAWVKREAICTVITIDAPYLGATPEAVLRHELGHCNGWPADHPD